ncbi:integrase core domain-containing protein [Paenibacillus lautus]|uniref:integrase core domain-containing protein n=1 Tax=Paenibacillus lautus TaxID=1401 RepID=UPI003D2B2824
MHCGGPLSIRCFNEEGYQPELRHSNLFTNKAEAYNEVTSYIDYYNERRIHSSIGVSTITSLW